MVWQALMQFADLAWLALVPTTVDRIIVWGLLALVVGLIAWREYTLPDVSPPSRPASKSATWLNAEPASDPGRADLLLQAAPAEKSESGAVD